MMLSDAFLAVEFNAMRPTDWLRQNRCVIWVFRRFCLSFLTVFFDCHLTCRILGRDNKWTYSSMYVVLVGQLDEISEFLKIFDFFFPESRFSAKNKT